MWDGSRVSFPCKNNASQFVFGRDNNPEKRRLNYSSSLSGPPLWSSGYSSWLQVQKSGIDSRRYQIFWEVVGLERVPISLVSTVEELLETKSIGSILEMREYDRRDPSRWPRGNLYPQKLALTWPTSGGHSVGIVRSWTQATKNLVCPSMSMLQLYKHSQHFIKFYIVEFQVCWPLPFLRTNDWVFTWRRKYLLCDTPVSIVCK
jgi:hypothetical protein